MANNRIYLRCRTCGKTLFLGKCFGDGYYTNNDYYKDNTFLESLNKFYGEHNWCDGDPVDEHLEPKFVAKDVDNENNFEIAYEFYKDDILQDKENKNE